MKHTTTIYDFKLKTLQGKDFDFQTLKGKTLLIVNTASKCGFTSQYEGLEKLYLKYKDDDLVVLGFPCNQFLNQEPGNLSDIQSFCSVNYSVSFPMFEKVDVNGKNAHPLFYYLKKMLPGFLTNTVKWNFTKFLIDKNGKPVKRFSSFIDPSKIDDYLVKKNIL